MIRSTPRIIIKRYANTYFAKNQLFGSLIGLSPQTTTHPNLFQQVQVRASNSFKNIHSGHG